MHFSNVDTALNDNKLEAWKWRLILRVFFGSWAGFKARWKFMSNKLDRVKCLFVTFRNLIHLNASFARWGGSLRLSLPRVSVSNLWKMGSSQPRTSGVRYQVPVLCLSAFSSSWNFFLRSLSIRLGRWPIKDRVKHQPPLPPREVNNSADKGICPLAQLQQLAILH